MGKAARITVKLSPGGRKNAVQGWAEGPEGSRWLKCSVTTAPDKGKANEALIELLAEYLGTPKSAFRIVRGQADRVKDIEIQGLTKAALSTKS